MAQSATYYQNQVRRDIGDVGRNAVFLVTIPAAATGGNVSLSFNGQTATVGRFATPEQVRAALEALPLIGAGNVDVQWDENATWRIEFIGALAAAAVPMISASGTGLTPVGEVSVKLQAQGKKPYLSDARIAEMWQANSEHADVQLRYLHTFKAAVKEFMGFVWTQVNQTVGDERKDYSDQYDHLKDMLERADDEIAERLRDANGERIAANHNTGVAKLKTMTPNGLPYGVVGRDGMGRWR